MRNANLLAMVFSMAIMPLANATTVGFSPAPGARTLKDSAGTNISATSLAWAGNFSNESFSLNNALTLQQNVNAIIVAGGWEQFGMDTASPIPNSPNVATTTLTISAGAKLGGSITDSTTGATKADYFNGKALYVWVFNGATVEASTEMGIFKATSAVTPWVFPTNAGGGLGDDLLYSTQNGGSTNVVAVAVNGIGSTSSTLLTLTGVTVSPVPEPSTFTACAMLAFAAMGARRRRR